MCGEEITPADRVRAHLIPKMLKPKNNVFIFLHKKCEKRINDLYVHQQPKKESEKVKKKALNMIKTVKDQIKIMEERIQNEE